MLLIAVFYAKYHHIMQMEQYTIEEKVIERAYKKLALDALVIQQGRLAEQKSKKFQDDVSHSFPAECLGVLMLDCYYLCSCK